MKIDVKDIPDTQEHKRLKQLRQGENERGLGSLRSALNEVDRYVANRIDHQRASPSEVRQSIIDLLRIEGLESRSICVGTMTRLALLTSREADILDGLVNGKTSKALAYELSISPKTVEMHRAQIMRKMECSNLFALGRAWEAAVRDFLSRAAFKIEDGGSA